MGIPTRMVRPFVYLLFAIGSSRNFSSSKRGAGFETRPERVFSGAVAFLLLFSVDPDILICLDVLTANTYQYVSARLLSILQGASR